MLRHQNLGTEWWCFRAIKIWRWKLFWEVNLPFWQRVKTNAISQNLPCSGTSEILMFTKKLHLRHYWGSDLRVTISQPFFTRGPSSSLSRTPLYTVTFGSLCPLLVCICLFPWKICQSLARKLHMDSTRLLSRSLGNLWMMGLETCTAEQSFKIILQPCM